MRLGNRGGPYRSISRAIIRVTCGTLSDPSLGGEQSTRRPVEQTSVPGAQRALLSRGNRLVWFAFSTSEALKLAAAFLLERAAGLWRLICCQRE